MRKNIKTLLKFLPVIILLVFFFVPADAMAFSLNPLDWVGDAIDAAVDVAERAAAAALGIDLTDNCVVPVNNPSPNCMFCPMFEIFFNSAALVATAAYDLFHSDLGKLILIFLGVSMAVIILKNVSSMGTKDTGAMLNDIVSRVFICAVVFIIVTQDYYNILNMTLVPVIKDGFDFAGLNSAGCLAAVSGRMHGYMGAAGGYMNDSGGGQVISQEIGTSVIGAICTIEQKIKMLFDYGEWAFCRGNGPDRMWHLVPHPVYILDGILFYIAGVLFMVAYPWIMADAVLQIGISLALLPFAITGYAFGGTKRYMAAVFNWILNSMFIFLFMSILLTIILDYVGKALGVAVAGAGDYSVLFTDPNRGVAFYGPNMMKILFILLIGYIYMSSIRDLADNFAKGASLSAGSTVGKAVTDQAEKQAMKVGNYAVNATGKAALSTASTAKRYFNATSRKGAMFLVNRLGHIDDEGNRTFTIGTTSNRWYGRTTRFLTRGLSFTTERDDDGNAILRREFKSATGRRHVMRSDKYSTIKQEYDRNGNLIKNQVRFKYNFATKYLLNKDGLVNTDAVKTLLNSSMAQNPQYKEAIMAQLAVDILQKRGYHVAAYYKSRNVTFDPNNPNKIMVEQVDHNGKVTQFAMDINMETGQVTTGFGQDITPSQPLRRSERDFRMKLHKLFLNKHTGHAVGSNAVGFRTFWGTNYLMGTNAQGEQFYSKNRRKYWLFGPEVEKTFYANRTETNVVRSEGAQRRTQRKMQKIQEKLNQQQEFVDNIISNGQSLPNGNTGYTDDKGRTYEVGRDGNGIYFTRQKRKFGIFGPMVEKKTYIDSSTTSDWRYNYRAVTAADGSVTYERNLRSGWNVKNYVRAGANTVNFALKAPKAALNAATFVLVHPYRALAVTPYRFIRHPKDSFSNLWHSAKDGTVGAFTSSYGNTWQTGDIHTYSDNGRSVVDSYTRKTVKDTATDATIVKNINGERSYTNEQTGDTTTHLSRQKTQRVFVVDNGVSKIINNATLDSRGTIIKSTTEFQFSDKVRNSHDSILSSDDSNQVVDRNGVIAQDLRSRTTNNKANPFDLTYGLDGLFGVNTINGKTVSDTIVKEVYQKGRIYGFNKINMDISHYFMGGTYVDPNANPNEAYLEGNDEELALGNDNDNDTENLGNDDENNDESDDSSDDSTRGSHDDNSNDNDGRNDSNNGENTNSGNNNNNSNENRRDDENRNPPQTRNIIGPHGEVLGQIDANGRVTGLSISNYIVEGDIVYDANHVEIGRIDS